MILDIDMSKDGLAHDISVQNTLTPVRHESSDLQYFYYCSNVVQMCMHVTFPL